MNFEEISAKNVQNVEKIFVSIAKALLKGDFGGEIKGKLLGRLLSYIRKILNTGII